MFHISHPHLDEYVRQCCKDGSISEQAIDIKLTDVQGYLFLSLLSQQQKKMACVLKKIGWHLFSPFLLAYICSHDALQQQVCAVLRAK